MSLSDTITATPLEARGYREVPPEGWHDAVLVDYCHEGVQRLHGQERACVKLYWQIAARQTNGRRFLVSKRLHRAVGPRSTLRLWIERIRGKAYTAIDLSTIGLTIEQWIDFPCQLYVAHVPWKDRLPWVDVKNVVGWDPTLNRFPLRPEEYIRLEDRHRYPWLKVPASGKPHIR